jgi:hypothetical protein
VVLICQGTVAGSYQGSETLLAAKRVCSGLIYRDPWLLFPLLLPVFLAFCSLLDFLPEGRAEQWRGGIAHVLLLLVLGLGAC